MEVNVDLLDQMELIDISDQEALDVFFSSSGEEGGLASPLPGIKPWNYESQAVYASPNHVFHPSPGTQQKRGRHQ